MNLMSALLPAVRAAGEAIMRVYSHGMEVEEKEDGSPVTQADQAAETILLQALREIAPDIPVVSEENADSHSLAPPNLFFLVDPLDGTREFVKHDGKGCFTVNVGLISEGVPVMGIVNAPAQGRLFAGATGHGATENDRTILASQHGREDPVAVASISHRDAETEQWLLENGIRKTIAIGSSLKFCLIANGEADFYPRFGPTMEWDTAAGHAILLAAGGTMTRPDGSEFFYGKPGYRNVPFIARGG